MLLGLTAVVLLLAVLCASFIALEYTKSSLLRGDQRHLREATNSLVRKYSDEAELGRLSQKPEPLESAQTESNQNAFTNLSKSVLQNVQGVEGGFYSSAQDALIGYSFPTRAEALAKSATEDISSDIRPVALQVAQEAVASRRPVQRVLTLGQNTILIDAVPFSNEQGYLESAWTLMRLASIPGANRLRAYLIAVCLGIVAFACVLLTLFTVRGLQNGVRKIEGGLKGLENDLASEIPIESDPDEIRQIAQAINRLGNTLREKIDNEKQIADRLRHAERLAALGRLIAGVAHEVRNPLATIRLRIQMCQQDSSSIDVRESCAVALQEVERLNEMVNRLLSFARPVHLQTERTSIGQLIEHRLANFAELARKHNVKLLARSDHASKPVQIDQNRIAEVFDNIIHNAIDAMAESGGTLCVNVTAEAETSESSEVCVEFNDTGVGIGSDVIGRVFDPFFTTKSSGTGLGLSICHELVRAHGGQIQVTSAQGRGTTVRILLPVRHEQTTAQLA
jgi:signal transduction histidine kinase